eukprot:898063-Amorphochlora_amoeboformis.AAC.2
MLGRSSLGTCLENQASECEILRIQAWKRGTGKVAGIHREPGGGGDGRDGDGGQRKVEYGCFQQCFSLRIRLGIRGLEGPMDDTVSYTVELEYIRG